MLVRVVDPQRPRTSNCHPGAAACMHICVISRDNRHTELSVANTKRYAAGGAPKVSFPRRYWRECRIRRRWWPLPPFRALAPGLPRYICSLAMIVQIFSRPEIWRWPHRSRGCGDYRGGLLPRNSQCWPRLGALGGLWRRGFCGIIGGMSQAARRARRVSTPNAHRFR